MLKLAAASILSVLVLTPVLAADTPTYSKDIKPLWDAKCASCHGVRAPYYGDFKEDTQKYVKRALGPRMDTYADLLFFIGWPDTGAIMRRLDDGKSAANGKPGNMYGYLGDSEQERQKNLAVFKAWIGEDAWILKRWNAKGEVPAVTKEELDKVKAKY